MLLLIAIELGSHNILVVTVCFCFGIPCRCLYSQLIWNLCIASVQCEIWIERRHWTDPSCPVSLGRSPQKVQQNKGHFNWTVCELMVSTFSQNESQCWVGWLKVERSGYREVIFPCSRRAAPLNGKTHCFQIKSSDHGSVMFSRSLSVFRYE